MSPTVPVLVYVTAVLSQEEHSSLIHKLNEPNEEFLEPYPDLPKLVHESTAPHLEGKTVDEIIEIHRQWSADSEQRWKEENGDSGSRWRNWSGSCTFVVADEEASLEAQPRKVLVVHLPELDNASVAFESKRVPIEEAVHVINIADVQGWESEI